MAALPARRTDLLRFGVGKETSVYDTSCPDREVVDIRDPLFRKPEFPPPAGAPGEALK